jgi:hypothetical protein
MDNGHGSSQGPQEIRQIQTLSITEMCVIHFSEI